MEELNYTIFAEGLKDWQRDLLYRILNLVASLFPGATFMGYAAPEVEPLDEGVLHSSVDNIMGVNPISQLEIHKQIDEFLKKGPTDG